MATPYAEGSQESIWRGLLRPFHGSTFGLGQPDRLRRQAHSNVRFAHYDTIDSCPRCVLLDVTTGKNAGQENTHRVVAAIAAIDT